MVWACMSAAGTEELQFIEGNMNYNMYCDILKQNMMPSLQKLGRTAVSNKIMTQTPHQDDNCLADEAEGEGDGVAKYVSRPEPY